MHFISERPVYTDEQNMLYNNISKVCTNICNLLSHQKFIWPFSNENIDVIKMFSEHFYRINMFITKMPLYSQFIYNCHCKQFTLSIVKKVNVSPVSLRKSI